MTESIATKARSDCWTILAAVCMAALVLPLDFSGAAAATPAIGREFGGRTLTLAWVVNAFMLTFGSTLLTAGALADAFGRRRVFSTGLVAFVALSIAIAFARTLLILDVLRAAQGLAAAATLAGASAAVAQEFEGEARTRAFSLLGTTFGTGLAFGPTIAGLLIDAASWRAIFLVSAAVGALALVIGVPRMRETRDPAAASPDWLGATTFTTALALLTAGLLQVSDGGWFSTGSVGLLSGATLALGVFIVVERSVARPMLDLSLFRYARFAGVQVLPIATCYSYVVLLVLLPARFIGIESYKELDAGLLMLALSAPMLIVPYATAVLTRRLSEGLLAGLGLLIAAAGLVWMAAMAPGAPVARLVPAMILVGLGTAMPWGLMDGLSVSVVPTERAGMATGIFSTVRVAGEGIALAIVRAILSGLLRAQLLPHLPADAARLAARAATGDLSPANGLLSRAETALLIQAYGTAFADLLHILATIAAVSSLVVFLCLRKSAGRH